MQPFILLFSLVISLKMMSFLSGEQCGLLNSFFNLFLLFLFFSRFWSMMSSGLFVCLLFFRLQPHPITSSATLFFARKRCVLDDSLYVFFLVNMLRAFF